MRPKRPVDGLFRVARQSAVVVAEIAREPKARKRAGLGLVLVIAASFIIATIINHSAKADIKPIDEHQAVITTDGQAAPAFTSSQQPQFAVGTAGMVRQNSAKTAKSKLEASQGVISAEVVDNNQSQMGVEPVITKGSASDQFTVTVPVSQHQFKPGKMTLKIELDGPNDHKSLKQDFTWGVLAVNLDQSTYSTGEMVNIGMGVLSDTGKTVCDAKVTLAITDPNGQQTTVTNADGGVKVSNTCANANVTNNPDYSASYKVKAEGKYQVSLHAETKNGPRSTQITFEVKNKADFVIKRHDTSMRIYPLYDYTVKTTVVATRSINGLASEKVPANFTIKQAGGGKVVDKNADTQTIVWPIELAAGQSKELEYTYHAPEVSPELYLLGPMEISSAGKTVFTEPRAWQVASDGAADVILLWDGGSGNDAPSGWTCISCTSGDAFFQKFPRAKPTYSGTGGGAETGVTHTISYSGGTANSGAAVNITTVNTVSGAVVSAAGHTHSAPANITSGGASIVPQYQNLKFIRKTDPISLPAGVIGMFDTATMPTNWTAYDPLNNDSGVARYLRGEGGALGSGGAATHNHSRAISGATGAANTTQTANTITATVAASVNTHTHTVPAGTSPDHDNDPSYATVVFAKLGAGGDGSAPPDGLIGMFDDTALPTGWSIISTAGSSYDGKLLKGTTSCTCPSTGGSDTHTHADQTVTTSAASTLSVTTLTTGVAPGGHTHDYTVSYASANSMPNYRDVILGKLKAIDISGTVYTDEGSTNIGSGKTLKAVVNGTGFRLATTTAGGAWTAKVPDPGAGTPITVWIDNVSSTTGAVITRSSGSAITGLDIYQNRLIVRHDDSGPLSNANIAVCTKTKGTQCGATSTENDLHYDTDGSNNLTIDSDWRLYIWGGKTFTPGATVTTSARTAGVGGDIKWGNSTSTLTMAANALSVGGDWDNSVGGVFNNSGSQTTTFNGNQAATTYLIDPGNNATNSFLNLTFNASANGLWSVRSNKLTVTADLTVTAGTFGDGSDTGDIEVQGTVACGASCGTINAVGSGRTFKQNVAAAKNFGTNVAVSTVWSFNNLTFASSSGSRTITTSSTGTGNIVTKSVLTIGSSTTLDAGNRTFELDGNGTPFVKTGTLTQNTSTFLFQPSATSGVTVANATYHHITFNKASNIFSLTTSGITTDTANSGGNLTITAGTLDTVSGSNFAISVGGNWSNSGSFLAQAGTVTFTATGTGHTIGGNLTGSNKFNNLIFNGSGGAWSFGSTSADVGSDMTITTGTVTAPSTTLTITGSYSNAATFTHNSGTVTFNSTATGKTIDSGGTTNGVFNNVTFNGSGGGWTIQTNDLKAVGNLVATLGTVNDSAVNITVNGNVDCGSSVSTCGQLNVTGGLFLQRATAAAADFGPNATAAYNTNWNFNNLSFEDGRGSTSNPTTITVNGNSGSTILNITAGLTVGNAGDPSGNTTTLDDSGTNKRPITVGTNVNVTSKGLFTAPGSGLAFNVAGNWTNSNTFTHNSGTVTFNGTASGKTIVANGSSGNFNNVTFNGAGGVWSPNTNAMNVVGDLTMTAGTLDGSTGTPTDVTVNGNLVGTAGTINFTASNKVTQRVSANKNFGPTTASNNWNFNNLTFSNSNGGATPVTITTQSGTGTMTVAGQLLVGASGDASGATTTLDAANRTWTLSKSGSGASAPFIILAAPAGSLTPSTSTFNYTGTAATDLQAATYYNLTVNAASGTPTFSATGNTTVNNNLTITAGTYASGGNNVSVSNDLILNGSGGTLTGTGNQTVNGNVNCGGGTCGTITITGGTFTQSVASSKNFGTTQGALDWSFNNLTFTGTSGSPTITINPTGSGKINPAGNLSTTNSGTALTLDNNTNDRVLDVNGDVSIGSGTTFEATSNTGTTDFTVFGSWTNSGNFHNNAGTVTFDGTASGKTINTGGTGSNNDFNNVTFNGTSGGHWTPQTNTMTVTGNLTMTGGNFDSTTGTPSNVIVNKDAVGTAGVINFTATNTFTHKATAARSFGSTTGTAWTFNNLTEDNDGSARTITASSGIGTTTVNAVWTITASTTYAAGTGLYILAGTGTPLVKTGTFTYNTSTVRYTGNGATNVTALPGLSGNDGYYNLEVKPAGATAHTLCTAGSQTIAVNNNFTVGDGTNAGATAATNDCTLDVNNDVSISASATLTASATAAFTVAGNWTNAGTFTANSGTVTFDNGGATNKTIDNNSSTFFNLTFNGGNISTTTWSPRTNKLIVANDLTMTKGTLGTGSDTADVETRGNVVGNGANGVLNFTTAASPGRNFTHRPSASKSFGTGATVAWTFVNLNFANGSGSGITTTVDNPGSGGSITVSRELRIGCGNSGGCSGYTDSGSATTSLNPGNRSWTLSGTTGTPFIILASPAGTLVPNSTSSTNTSTFNYTGNNGGGNTTVQAATYYKLVINNSSETYDAGGGVVAESDVAVTAGTLAMAGNNLTVGISGVSNSGGISVAGTISQSTSGTTSVRSSSGGAATVGGAGTIGFGNLTFDPSVASGPTFTLGSSGGSVISVGNDLTIGNGTNPVTVTLDTNDRDLTVSRHVQINASGILTASNSAAFNVAGNWTNAGTFNHSSGTVTFNGSVAGTKTIDIGASSNLFNNLTFNGGGGAWSPRNNLLKIATDLTMTAGTLGTASDSANVEVDGNAVGTSGVVNMTTTSNPGNTFTHKATGGNKTFGTTSGATAWTIYNLTFDNDGSARTISAGAGTGKVTIQNIWTITTSTTFNSGNRQYDLTGSGTPLNASGTFTADSSSNKSNVTYNGQSATNVDNLTYYDMGVGTTSDSSASVTYSLTGFTKVLDVLTLGNSGSTNIDHLSGLSFTLELAGTGTPLNATSKGDYIVGTSTVNYTGQDASNPIFVAALSFYNLGAGTTADSVATTYKLSGNTTVTNVLTVGNNSSTASDTFDGSSFTLTLSGTGTPFVVTTQGNWGPSTSTVNYTGQDASNPIFVGGTNYYNLGAGTTADGVATTYKLAGNALVTHQLTVGNTSSTAVDTFDGATFTLTLSGSGQGASAPFQVTSQGTWGPSTSTVNYTASTGTTDVAGTSYYNLGIGTTADATAANTFVLTGSATVANVLTLGNTSSTNGDILDGGSGTVTFTLSGSNVTPFVFNNGTSTNSSFIANTGTVNYTGTGTINLAPVTFYNLGLRNLVDPTGSATTFTLPGNTTINNVLTVGNSGSASSTTLDGATYILTLAGSGTPFVLASSGKGLFTPSTSTVNYTGTSATTITATTYYNLGAGTTSDVAAGVTYTLGGNMTVSHQLTVGNSGSTNTDTLALSSVTLTLSGSGTGASAPFVVTSKGTTTAGTSTVNYTANATTDVASVNYYNLGVGTTADAVSTTYNLSGCPATTTVNNVLTIGAISEAPSHPDHLSGGSCTLNLAGTGTPLHADNGDYIVGTSTVNYTGADGSNPINVAALNYYNLGVGTAADSTATTYQLTGNTKVTHQLTIGAASSTATDHLAGLTFTLELSGTGTGGSAPIQTPSNHGDYVVGTSTVNYTGDGANTDVSPLSYYNLGIGTNVLAGATSYLMTGTTTVTHQLILGTSSGQNATFDANGSNTLKFTGGGTGAAAPFKANTSGVFAPSTGTVEYDGSTDTDVPARTFYNLKFNPPSGSPNFYLLAGTLTINSGGSLAITTSGSATEVVHAETYNPTINLNADFSLSIGTFIASGTATFTVSGNWSNSATFTANGGTVTFNNTAATNKTINTGGTGPGKDFYNITFNSGAGGTTTSWSPLTSTLVADNNLTITSGKLDNSNGSADVIVNGNLTGDGTNSQINFTTNTVNQRASADKSFGTNSSGAANWTFKNLTFSNGQTVSALPITITTSTSGTGSITVTGTMRIGGTGPDAGGASTILDAGNRTWNISGSGTGGSAPFIISSGPIGTLTPSTSTFNYTGTAATDLQSATYYNLTVNAASGTPTFNAGSGILVNNNLTVTAGVFSLGANDITVGSTGVTNSGTIAVATGATYSQTAAGTTYVQTSSGSSTPTVGGAGTLTFYNLNFNQPTVGSAPTIKLGSAASQTLTINGNLTVGNGTQAVTVSAATNGPTIVLGTGNTAGDMIINASGTFVAPNCASCFTVNGHWTNNGTFTAGTGTVIFNSTDLANRTLSGTLSGSSAFNNLTFDSGGTNGFWTYSSVILVTGNLAITSGQVDGNLDITVNKDVTGGATGVLRLVGGTFTQRVNANQAFGTTTGSKNWMFNNLTFSNSGATTRTITGGAGTGDVTVNGIMKVGVTGDPGSTTFVAGGSRNWNLTGSGTGSSRPLQIASSPAGTLTGGTTTFNYSGTSTTDIEPATYFNLALIPITGSPTYNFLAGTYTVGGVLNVGNGAAAVTATAATNNPTIAVTGVTTILPGATLTDGTGSQTFSSDLVINGTLNGAGGLTVNGNVTGSGTVNMTGGTFTQSIASAKTFGSTGNSNNWVFNALTLTSTTGTLTLTINGGGSGIIETNGLFQITTSGTALTVDDGTVTTNRIIDADGDFTIGTNTTFSAPALASFTVGGSWTSTGTFTNNSGTVTFDESISGAKTISLNTSSSGSFYNLTFNGGSSNTADAWSPRTNNSSVLTVTNDLTMTGGTLGSGADTADVTVNGNVVGTNGVINTTAASRTFTQRVASNKNFGTTSSSNDWTFTNLTFSNSNSGATAITITPSVGGTGKFVTGSALNIGVAGDATGATTTFADGVSNRAVTVGGDITITTKGIMQAPPTANFNVAGSFANNNVFTNDSGTITFNGTATGKTIGGSGGLTGTNAFNNLTVNGSGGGWTINTTNADVNGNLVITAGSLTAPTGNLTLSGNYSNAGSFVDNSGTVIFNASTTGKTITTGGTTGTQDFNIVQFNNANGGWTIQTNNFKAKSTFTLTAINTTAATGLVVNSGLTVEVDGNYVLGSDSIPSGTNWASTSVLFLNSGNNYTVGTKTQAAEVYGTLQVGANTDVRTWNSSATTDTVDATGSLYSQNDANIAGHLNIYGDYHTLNATTDYWKFDTEFDGTALSAGAKRQPIVRIQSGSGLGVTVDSGGTLRPTGGGGGANQFTDIDSINGSTDYQLINSGTQITANAKIKHADFSGTGNWAVRNTVVTNYTVVGGTLEPIWYFSIHVLDRDNTGTNIQTSTGDITVAENGGATTVWLGDGTTIGSGASQVTESASDGHTPANFAVDGIALSQFKQTSGGTTDYKYNVTVKKQSKYANYDYQRDFGKYLTSTSSANSEDKVIGTSWYRDNIAVENPHQLAVNGVGATNGVLTGSQVVGMSQSMILFYDQSSGTTTVPTGWVCVSCVSGDTYFQKFPRGNTTAGGTGGATITGHTLSSPVQSMPSSSGTSVTGTTSLSNQTHNHTTIPSTASTSSDSIVPPYHNLKIIEGPVSGPDAWPQNSIAPFETATTPSGWTTYSTTAFPTGDYVRGDETIANGANGGAATHTHTAPASGFTLGAAPEVTSTACVTGCVSGANAAHTHTVTANSTTFPASPFSNNPQFANVVFMQCTTGGGCTSAPDKVLGLFDYSSGFPLNWSLVSNGAPYNKSLLVNAASATGTGNAAGGVLSHGGGTVALTSSTNASTTTYLSAAGTAMATGAHNHTITYNVSTDTENSEPPYVDVAIAKFAAPATISITGTAYEDEGTTKLAACNSVTNMIKASVGGTLVGPTTCSAVDGTYTISGVTKPNTGTPIVIWIDGATCNANNSNSCATTVTRYSGSGNASSEDLWRNRLIMTSDDGAPVSNADAATADNTTDGDIVYSVSSQNLTAESLTKLVVKSGKTYTPGGTVTTAASGTASSQEGDLTISSTATLSMGGNALSVGGDYTNSGTFSKSSGQTTSFTATSTGFNIAPGTGNFDNVVFNGSGGSWTITAAVVLDNNLTMTAGTVNGTNNVTVNGGNATGNGAINLTGGTFLLDGAGNFGGTAAWNFNNLTFGDGSGTTTTTALASGGGNITVASSLTIAANQTLSAGSHNYFLTKNGGTNFTITGTFTPQTSTITYQPSSTTQDNITATTYHNLTFDKTGASASFLLLGAITTDTASGGGNLSLNNGTLDVDNTNNYAVTVGGNWFTGSGGTLTARAGTVTFNATGPAHTIQINSTTSNFNNVTMNGSGGVWSPSGSQTMIATGDLTMTAGTFDTSSGTGNVEVRGNATGSAGVINFTTTNTFTQRAAAAKNFGPSTAGTNWGFNNLVFANSSGSGITITTASNADNVTVNGQLRLGCTNATLACTATDTAGTTLDANNRNWILAGSGTGANAPFVIQASPASTLTPTTSTFNYTGSATSDVASATYYKLVINHSGVTFNGGGAITANSDLAVVAGTFATTANLTVGSSAVTNSGTVAVSTGATLSQTSGTTTIDTKSTGGSYTIGGAGTTTFFNLIFDRPSTSGAATATLGSAPGQTITASGTLTVANTGTGSTTTVTANTNNPILTVGSDVTINASGTLVAPPTAAFNVGGSWTNNNVFTHNGGTVTFNAASGAKTLAGTISGSNGAFNNLTFNGGSAATWTNSAAMDVKNNMTVTDGTYTQTANNVTTTVNGAVVGGNAGDNTGIINMTTGTLEQRMAANQNFGTTAGSGNWTFNNLILSNSNSGSTSPVTSVTQTGGSGTITVGTVLTIGKSGDTSATNLNAGNRVWILTGTGTPLVFNGSSALIGNTSTFRYTGNGATNITASTGYNNLQIFPGGASVTHTLSAGTFSLSGFLDLGGNSNATGTVITSATNNPTISSVHNLTICALTCSNQMTYIKGSNTLTLSPDGTKSWTDNNPTSKQDVGVVAIAGGTNTPVIQLGSDVKATYVNLATLHTLDANGSHNLILTGTTNTFFVANGTFIPSTGTVTYQPTAAGTVTVATTTYHHVVFDGSLNGSTSTFNLSSGGITTDTINSCGDLTIKDKSTLDTTAAAYPISVGGNWTVNSGGAFTARTGTVTLTDVTACGAKTIGGAVAMTGSNKFNNLTFNGSGGAWSFGGNSVDVGGNFTLTNGTVTAPGSGKVLTVNGNWTNTAGNSNFVANSGKVKITPALAATSTISGATTFYDFESSTGDRTLSFQNGGAGPSFSPIFTFANTVTLAGTLGHLLNIQSNDGTTPTKWKVHFNSAQTGTNLFVKNSGCDTGTSNITMDTNSVNGGNNESCWVFGTTTPPNSPTLLLQKRVTAGTNLNVGDWTNETQADFFGTVSDPTSLNTSLCVEAQPINTAFTNTETACGTAVATGSTATVRLTGLSDQTEYHWQARAKNSAGTYSLLWIAYPAVPDTPNLDTPLPAIRDFGVDTSAPTTGTVYDNDNSVSQPSLVDVNENGDGSLTTLSASWSAFSSGIAGFNFYEYSIGTSPGAQNIKAWTKSGPSGTGANTFIRDSSLTLQTNVTYYFNVRATDLANNVSSVVSSDGLHVTPKVTFGLGIGGPTDPGNTSPPYAVNFGTLSLGSVNTSPSSQKVWVHVTTNGAAGLNIFLAGLNAGLKSILAGNAKIDSVGGSQDLSSGGVTEGFGAQAISGDTSQITILSPYDGTGSVVGPTDTTLRKIFDATSPVLSPAGVGSFQLMAKPNVATPAANDYTETLTVIGASTY